MSKKENRRLIKEGKALSTYKLQKLAGLITENAFDKEVELASNMAGAWLSHEGEAKVRSSLEERVQTYLETSAHDYDEDGPSFTAPRVDDFANGDELLDEFYDDLFMFIEKIGMTELLGMFEDGDLSDGVERVVSAKLEQYARSIFDDVVDDLLDGMQRSADPHAYYGVSQKDFF